MVRTNFKIEGARAKIQKSWERCAVCSPKDMNKPLFEGSTTTEIVELKEENIYCWNELQ